MSVLQRSEIIEKLTKEKQILYVVLAAERAFRELYKVCPDYLDKHTSFREVLDEIWKYLAGKNQLSTDDWKKMFLEINKKYEGKSKKLVDLSLLETARAINFALAAIIWGRDVDKLSFGGEDKAMQVVSQVYEDKIDYSSRENANGLFMKEAEWLTNALRLIAESDELPSNYEWFRSRIPEYERGEISKKLIQKYKDLERGH